MNTDFDSLETFEDWSNLLEALLVRAKDALQSGNAQQKSDVQRDLGAFIDNSPNKIAGQLDDMARKTINDILDTAINQALGNIEARTSELALHVKTINAVTEAAERRAKSIRLESARGVIDSTGAAIRSLTDLRQALNDTSDDKLVADKIDEAVKAINDLVPAVTRLT
jgi:hypothetical protein